MRSKEVLLRFLTQRGIRGDHVCALAIITPLLIPSLARADEPNKAVPKLQWDKPIRCIQRADGETVRAQCEEKDGKRTCLVAPNRMKTGGDLNRTAVCAYGIEPSTLLRGATLIEAIAEAPPGYERDKNGRAFQVAFDMLNRVYFGGGYAPTFVRRAPGLAAPPSGFPAGRGFVEIGFQASALSHKGRSRHDMRVLEGDIAFRDFEWNGLVFSYDYQHSHQRPAFWLSTFVGTPRVYGVPLPFGWGFRTLQVNHRMPSTEGALDVEFAEVHAAWNPWQSPDLASHLRLEVGSDVGRYWGSQAEVKEGFSGGRMYVGFTSAIKWRMFADPRGQHTITADLSYQRPTFFSESGRVSKNRLNGLLAYEAILIALNDQPISARVTAQGRMFEDPLSNARAVEGRLGVGLRFSLWAPAPSREPLPELEDP